MCGIYGRASADYKNISRERLLLSRDLLSHRGPDDHGEWWSTDQRVAFGHRRLSIIDLSSSSRQPLSTKDDKYSVVFNGEIYNYKSLRGDLEKLGNVFCSNGDTEVILKSYIEWGRDCILRFHGAFAFAIYDQNMGRIFLARDRAGEKPLFYTHKDSSLEFASELKSLLCDPQNPRNINYEALDCYLAMGFVPGDRCMIDGCNKLPPAHAMEFNLQTGEIKTWRYWSIPAPDLLNNADDNNDLLYQLEELINNAVQSQMSADVPVGILLSGGLDSSIITAAAAKINRPLKTFTVGFSSSEKHDEKSYAKQISNYFQSEHHEINGEEAIGDSLNNLFYIFDEPVVDSSVIPTFLVCKFVRSYCKVVLGGDGADEVFGGYPEYCRIQTMEKICKSIPLSIRGPISRVGEYLPIGFLGSNCRSWISAVGNKFETEIPFVAKYFNLRDRRRLMGKSYTHIGFGELFRKQRSSTDYDIIQRMTRLDFENYLAEDILVKCDRSSMANSVEMRCPFLDKNLVEFAFQRIPSYLKVKNGQRKIILKKLAKKLLPNNFNIDRKQGFSIPMAKWLNGGSMRELFWDTLSSNDLSFDRKMCSKLLRDQDRGAWNGEQLFALVQFELWKNYYRISM